MAEYYAKNKEIKLEFFRGVKNFPSENTVDNDTNLKWKTDISDHIDEVLRNTSATRLTDRKGILKRRFMKCYRRKLNTKDWELTSKEKRELRHAWGKPTMTMHHPQDYEVNQSG